MSRRPNYVLLLDLDPDDRSSDDWKAIEARVVDKKREWNRQRSQGAPDRRRRAEQALGLLDDLRAVLGNPESRAEELREARRQRQTERDAIEKELSELIEVRRADGRITRAGFLRLVQRFKGSIDAHRIEARLRAAGITIGEPRAEATGAERPTLDKSKARNIEALCAQLGHESLYDFLGLSGRSSLALLKERAVEIYQEIQKLGLIDAHSSARTELAGECQAIFADETEKARYDNYHAERSMHALDGHIDEAGEKGFITQAALDVLLRHARARRVEAAEARAYIEAYAARKSWAIVPGDVGPRVELSRCGFCGGLARSPGQERCSSCGEAFLQPCPRCDAPQPTDQSACDRCGCNIGDAPFVKGLYRTLRESFARGDFAEALRLVDRILTVWPDWSEAIGARAEFAAALEDRERETRAIERLVDERRFMEARTQLTRLARGGLTVPALESLIEGGLSRAAAAHARGEALARKGQPEAAIDEHVEALSQCADFEPSRRALALIPPSPPGAITVAPFGAGLRVEWRPPSARGSLTYKVLRKARGRPVSATDGQVLGVVAGTHFDDLSATPGTAWFHAVYTIRGGVTSAEGACSGPYLQLGEVSDLRAVPGNGQMMLSWTRPPGCVGVEVTRALDRAPSRSGVVLRVTGDSLLDEGLSNGRIHGYRVVALFEDPARRGEYIPSAGQCITAAPQAPPPAITDLRCERRGRSVLLRWTPPPPPATSHVRAIRGAPPEVHSGQVIATPDLPRLGDPLTSLGAGSAQYTLTGQGRVCFVPISGAGPVAVAGSIRAVTSIDGVTGVSSEVSGSSIHLTWTWPDGVDEVRVRWAHDRYPPSAVGGPASSARVTRAEYERHGTWVLSNVPRKLHYIAIFAQAPGSDLYAEPGLRLEPVGSAANLPYQVRMVRSGILRRVTGALIEIEAPPSESVELPALKVVARPGRLPTGPDDGEVLVTARGLAMQGGRATIPLPADALGRDLRVRLYFEDADDAQRYRLLPGEPDRLRVV